MDHTVYFVICTNVDLPVCIFFFLNESNFLLLIKVIPLKKRAFIAMRLKGNDS